MNFFTEFSGLDQALFHYRLHGEHWSVWLLLNVQISFICELCFYLIVN